MEATRPVRRPFAVARLNFPRSSELDKRCLYENPLNRVKFGEPPLPLSILYYLNIVAIIILSQLTARCDQQRPFVSRATRALAVEGR